MINSITHLATHQPTHYAPNGLYANENDANDEFHSLYYYLLSLHFFSLIGRGYFLSMEAFMMPPFFFVKKKTILPLLFFILLLSPLSFLFIPPDYCSSPSM